MIAILVISTLAEPSRVAAQAITFESISLSSGIQTQSGGTGVAVYDFDQDGWDDITIALKNARPALFRNNRDNTFTNIAEESGIEGGGNAVVPLWADVDMDGFPDLFLGHKGAGINRLYHNNGDGSFTDVAVDAGIPLHAVIGSAAFGDYDGDMAPDLYLAVDRGYDILLRNRGDGSFEDVSASAGVSGMERSVAMQMMWVDYDLDGDQDLFVVHDGSTRSRLLVNEGFLPLINIASSVNIDDIGAGNSMGIAWGDVTGDGIPDAYVSRIGTAGLYVGDGSGGFTEEAVQRGVDRNGMSWGVVMEDFDNDGQKDLFVVSTSGYDSTPTLLFHNADGIFSEIGEAAGISILTEAKGLAAGDFNRDGWIDLVFPSATGSHSIFLNTTSNNSNWINVQAVDKMSGPAIGARVEIFAAGLHQIEFVHAGESFCSQSTPIAHFGVGRETVIDEIRIYWPDGSVSSETGSLVNRTLLFVQPGISVANETADFIDARFNLAQNYPNPVWKETTIPFELPEQMRVQFEIIDILGRIVYQQPPQLRNAGPNHIMVDASKLPAGQYIYRLVTSSGSKSRLMTVRQ